MITHDDSFVGASGRIGHYGGSRFSAVPTTVDVPTEYSIKVNANIQGDLLAHSLDGRLWLFRNGETLGIIALKHNSNTGRLEFAASLSLRSFSDVVLARGLDWILSNNTIFLVTETAPYIRYESLFSSTSAKSFMYSFLFNYAYFAYDAPNYQYTWLSYEAYRNTHIINRPCFDPFTGDIWGKRSDNGNSKGYGQFNKDTHLLYPAGTHSFEQCYSVLPAVGDWQIFENFLIRRPDATLSGRYNDMLNIRPLIPLEFSAGLAVYGTGYNFDHRGIQLACINGQLWARGLYNIGRVCITPALWDSKGEPQEFFLCIASDFPKLAAFKDKIYSFGRHSFALISSDLTWTQAQSVCEAFGGHLASSTSSEKNSFLTDIAGGATVWLGGTDKDNEGIWSWVTGETWDYTNWNSGEPNDYGGNEDFMQLISNGLWNDASGNATCPAICEWDSLDVPDNLPSYDKLDSGILALHDNSIAAYVNALDGNLSGGLSCSTLAPKLFLAQSNACLDLSEHNGKLFVDAAHGAGLLLNDEGAQILGKDFFECRTLPQWLAPNGSVDAVWDEQVLSAADDKVFATSFNRGFHRNILQKKDIPLTTGYSASAHSISVHASSLTFDVNDWRGEMAPYTRIAWNDIYKEPVSLRLINTFETEFYCFVHLLDDNLGVRQISYQIGPSGRLVFIKSSYVDFVYLNLDEEVYTKPFYDDRAKYFYGKFRYPYILSTSISGFFIDPETGIPSSFDLSTSSAHYPIHIFSKEDSVGYYDNAANDFIAVAKMPSNLLPFYRRYYGTIEAPYFESFTLRFITSDKLALFALHYADIIFALGLPSYYPLNKLYAKYPNLTHVIDYPDVDSLFVTSNGITLAKRNLHIAIFGNGGSNSLFLVFRSEINPDILDFYSEAQRSITA